MPLFQASGLLLSLNLSELIDYLVQFLCGIGICFSKGIELVDHGVGDLSLFGNAVNALFVVADNDIEMPGFLLDIINELGDPVNFVVGCVHGILKLSGNVVHIAEALGNVCYDKLNYLLEAVFDAYDIGVHLLADLKDLVCSNGGVGGEIFDLVCNHRKARTVGACSCSLNGSVNSKDITLLILYIF